MLGQDASNGIKPTILGIPVLVSAQVPAGVICGLDASRVLTVMRSGTTVAVSADYKFNSDQIAVRALARVGFSFPARKSVVNLALAAS